MDIRSQTARLLHDEHMAELARFERLESLLGSRGPGRPPTREEAGLTAHLIDLAAGGAPSEHHFAFEEATLFPRLADWGETGIGPLLTDEHVTIREVGAAVAALADAARREGFAPDAWRQFHRLGRELAERTIAHIQKEEMGLLPMLAQMLDDDEDTRLAMAYMAAR